MYRLMYSERVKQHYCFGIARFIHIVGHNNITVLTSDTSQSHIKLNMKWVGGREHVLQMIQANCVCMYARQAASTMRAY